VVIADDDYDNYFTEESIVENLNLYCHRGKDVADSVRVITETLSKLEDLGAVLNVTLPTETKSESFGTAHTVDSINYTTSGRISSSSPNPSNGPSNGLANGALGQTHSEADKIKAMSSTELAKYLVTTLGWQGHGTESALKHCDLEFLAANITLPVHIALHERIKKYWGNPQQAIRPVGGPSNGGNVSNNTSGTGPLPGTTSPLTFEEKKKAFMAKHNMTSFDIL
jgi:hypothetical protein